MKKYLNLTTFSLFIIILFGAFLRFYKLGEIPAGLYLDEAGQGYSAYSILKTGKDEFGKSLPVVFRSFNDFKTPLYIYLVVPLIPFFGLTKFTVRFPSFFFSVLTFPILYLFIKKITPPRWPNGLLGRWDFFALLSTLLLAISPWHILFGRTNFECNVALFFMLSGLLVFYCSLHKPKLLILSAILFAIAIPAYHSQRIITPVLLLVLFIRFYKILLSPTHKKFTVAGVIIGLLISLPTLSVMATPGFLARAGSLNIFSQTGKLPSGFSESCSGLACTITNNSFFLSLQEFASLYLSYFSARSMFILGDSGLRSSFPYLATFFFWQFPFYIYGLYVIFKNKSLKELRFIVLTLLFISPIPAAITRDPYSTIRSLPLVIPQTIIVALGIQNLSSEIVLRLRRTSEVRFLDFFSKGIIFLSALLILVYSLFKLHSSVFILNEYYRAREWNYGWEQVVEVIKTKTDPNLPIVVDNARGEPYSQLLFFLKSDPIKYQQENFEVPPDEYYTNMNRNMEKKIGRITTRSINWKPDLEVEQYLVGDELAISYQQIERHNLTLIEEIFYPDGTPAFRIVKTNPKKDGL
jgi:4-amino-4-deoxy-L-arabinose transferase-like glycosyltransferase